MQVRVAHQTRQLDEVVALVDRLPARVGADPVSSTNPYWNRVVVTILDPDGFHVVLVAGSWPADRSPHRPDPRPGERMAG